MCWGILKVGELFRFVLIKKKNPTNGNVRTASPHSSKTKIRDVMGNDIMCTEIILSAKPFRVKTQLSLKYLGASEF